MGQAKARGTYAERRAAALAKQAPKLDADKPVLMSRPQHIHGLLMLAALQGMARSTSPRFRIK